jgi:REP-associated tyrosine transposase
MSNHVHILLCSGPLGLAKFMRRLLTGYAVSYNLRHRRHEHVFQNRYKSIVCDGDSYFTELVRYIHLNPLRVELVRDLKELERYPYCGHGTILGTPARQWQVARLRECAGAVWEASFRCEGDLPEICCRGS